MVKGIFSSLLASVLFGGLYYLATYLKPLSGVEVFGFRILVTLPFLCLLILVIKQQREFIAFLKQIYHCPRLLLVLLSTSGLVGVQMWLFLWAPNAGRAIEVSIGYLLMPIVMVAVGKLLYKEHLTPLKWLAITCAACGVLSNILLTGHFSWASALVFTGYPFYFIVRKRFGISHIHSFVIEIALLVPVALYFVGQTDLTALQEQNPSIGIFLLLLGLMSGIALMAYTLASSLIPFNLLGLLGYVEPCAMLVIAFVIGERLSSEAYGLMAGLCAAISLLVLDSLLAIRRHKRSNLRLGRERV